MTGETEIRTVNYKGDVFNCFYVRQDPSTGPGWYVFGRNEKYDGRYIMLCARPNVKERRHPYYNKLVRRGWHTKREANAIAKEMNGG